MDSLKTLTVYVFFCLRCAATSILPEGGCAEGWEERRSGGKQCGKFLTSKGKFVVVVVVKSRIGLRYYYYVVYSREVERHLMNF